MKSKATQALDELNGFINVVVVIAADFYAVVEAAEDREDLIKYTQGQIDEVLGDPHIDQDDKISFLKIVQKQLESYFNNGDIIDSKYRNNVKTFFRGSVKYNYTSYVKEMQTLHEALTYEVFDRAKKAYEALEENLDSENYKLVKIKLPYTVSQPDLNLFFKELGSLGILFEFMAGAFETSWDYTVREEIRPYLTKMLIYDKSLLNSSILWEIMGHVLLKLDFLERENLTFKDLFEDEDKYHQIQKLFIKNDIVDPDSLSMGVTVPGSNNKHSTASLIAIADALNELNFLKRKYTRTEQVRIMAQTFKMKYSKATLNKKSPYHLDMVNYLRSLLS